MNNDTDILAEVEQAIREHVYVDDPYCTLMAAWVLHSYVFKLRPTTAYIAIHSPEKRCGKTTLLTVLSRLVHAPVLASNVTAGALFTLIDTQEPTLFIDEADTFLGRDELMRGVLNCGNVRETAFIFRKTTSSRKNADGTKTRTETAKKYNCYCPKAIAAIGEIPETLVDRSIIVELRRKNPTEPVKRVFDWDAIPLRQRVEAAANRFASRVEVAPRFTHAGLGDRLVDTLDPLWVVCCLAGVPAVQRFNAAVTHLFLSRKNQPINPSFLAATLIQFVEWGTEKMFSKHLCYLLSKHGFWPEDAQPNTRTETGLARMLGAYGVKAKVLRIGAEVARGYEINDLKGAFKLYIETAQLDAWLEEQATFDELAKEAKSVREAREKTGENAPTEPGEVDVEVFDDPLSKRIRRLEECNASLNKLLRHHQRQQVPLQQQCNAVTPENAKMPPMDALGLL